jgi:predicted RNA polymerase sigma factor
VDALRSDPSLQEYHLLPSVRGDLLMKLGRHAEAQVEFERAASLTRNTRERELLLARAARSRLAIGTTKITKATKEDPDLPL